MRNLNEKTPSNVPVYGKKNRFFFEFDHLVIKKKKMFDYVELARLEYKNIDKITYVKSSDIGLGKKLLGEVLGLLVTDNLNEDNYLSIEYSVNSDKAVSGYYTKLSDKEVGEMQALLKQRKGNA